MGETPEGATYAAGWDASSRRRRCVSGADDGHASSEEGPVMKGPWAT